MNEPLFLAVYPYCNDALALPVESVEAAFRWYAEAFGMAEIERRDGPPPAALTHASPDKR